MQLYSDEYRELNTQLHQENENYGKSGSKWAATVFTLAEKFRSRDILDYGCGKSTLSLHLPFTIQQYDPAIKKYGELPLSADIVVCTDVLEHIEPEHLDNVLNHLKSLTKKCALLTAATRTALKQLPDGRNAHLIVKPASWWIQTILQYFDIAEANCGKDEASFVCLPKGSLDA